MDEVALEGGTCLACIGLDAEVRSLQKELERYVMFKRFFPVSKLVNFIYTLFPYLNSVQRRRLKESDLNPQNFL